MRWLRCGIEPRDEALARVILARIATRAAG
jgi:hypothetical protein